jgi:hypothetical protein
MKKNPSDNLYQLMEKSNICGVFPFRRKRIYFSKASDPNLVAIFSLGFTAGKRRHGRLPIHFAGKVRLIRSSRSWDGVYKIGLHPRKPQQPSGASFLEVHCPRFADRLATHLD